MSIFKPHPLTAAALSLVLLGAPSTAISATVASGFDLLKTFDGTQLPFMGNTIAMVGAPWLITSPGCGSAQFNFNDGGGCRDVFNTSAIIHRLDDAVATPPGSASIDLEFVALALISKLPIPDLMGDYLVVRLLKDLVNDVWLYGADLGSSAEITFDNDDGGTFTTVLDFEYDVMLGSDPETTLLTQSLVLYQQSSTWGRIPPDGAGLIPGVNWNLDGFSNNWDFWSGETVHCSSFPDCDDGGHTHVTVPATVPVPAAGPLLAGALAVFGGFVGWRRRRHA
jgi:hypothetical protein